MNTENFSTRLPDTPFSTRIRWDKFLFFLDFLIELRYVSSRRHGTGRRDEIRYLFAGNG
jgi:hypothetical protein